MRIAAQIVSLQALYYVAATVLFLFTALVSGSPFSFRMILGWEYLRGDTSQGWLLSFIWVLDGGFCMYVQTTLPLLSCPYYHSFPCDLNPVFGRRGQAFCFSKC